MANDTELLTVGDVAKRLGLHEKTVREYIRDGLLPAVKLRREYRIDPEDLENFIQERKQIPKRDE